MQWSQLKHRLESLFAESVRGRVEIHSTTYHQWNDSGDAGRIWVTVDGREVLNLCTNYMLQYPDWMSERLTRQIADLKLPAPSANPDDSERKEHLIYWRHEAHALLFEYLNLSIEDAVTSQAPLVRGIAMLDRRLGKRRLSILRSQELHAWQRLMLDVRCEAEGMPPVRRDA